MNLITYCTVNELESACARDIPAGDEVDAAQQEAELRLRVVAHRFAVKSGDQVVG